MGGSEEKKKSVSVVVARVLLALALCGAAVCAGYVAWQKVAIGDAAQQSESAPEPDTLEDPQDPNGPLPENPIDFAELKKENSDVYAWIYIPNTNVNLPVLQHEADDNFYLDHNRYGAYAAEGAIYSQMVNAKDFSDPVTLLYGHCMSDNIMFSQLHFFENEEFFADNEFMYMYIPGHVLTYRIVSAYQYDDRHIMNSFDFADMDVRQHYFDYVANPDSLVVNVREDVQLNAETDKIVQLSTCTDSVYGSATRYIVSGVLVDDQPTR